MCNFVEHFWIIKNISMSRRKQAYPAKLDSQEDEPTSRRIRSNSSRLELLIEKIQSTKENGEFKVPVANTANTSRSSDTPLNQDSQSPKERKSGPYKCRICGDNFVKEKLLRHHEQMHTDHLQFTCQYCPRLFKHKRSRDRHTKLHTGDKKYKCQHCESAFSRSDHLKIHMKTHDSRKPYKCGTCNRGYNTAAALSSHQQCHLKQESRSGSRTSGGSTPSPGLFRCNQCSETFGKPDLLQNHISMVHSDSDASLSQTPEALPEYSNQKIEDLKIVCMYCSKEFPSLELMYQHTNIAHRDVSNNVIIRSISSPNLNKSPINEVFQNGNSPTYACDRCTMQFDSLEHLKNHCNIVHRKPVISPNSTVNYVVPTINIDKSYSPFQIQPTDLSRKKKKDDCKETSNKRKKSSVSPSTIDCDANDKPCICSCCYAQLPNFKSFLLHMETHMTTSNKQILGFCPVCGEPGRDTASFATHVVSHALIQVPGRCCYNCKTMFNTPEDLQKHLFDFHVLSVYKCTICKEVFDSTLAMQLHMSNKHSDECTHYKCYLCANQLFHDKLSAEVHISMKHFHHFLSPLSNNQSLLKTQYQVELDARLREYSGPTFQCTFCQKSFKDQYSQYIHLLKEHNDNKEGEKYLMDSILSQQTPSTSPTYLFPKILASPKTKPENSLETYTCDICNRSDFTSETELIGHKKLHHSKTNKIGTVSLQCAYCNEYCKSRNDLENHMKTHQVTCGKGKHKCNICDEIFSSVLTLADHKLTHCKIVDGNNCVQCKSLLTDEQSFYAHQLQHSTSSSKPNSQISLPANCIICCQTLQTDVELKLHAKFHLKHTIIKQYLCGVCNKIFDTQSGQIILTEKSTENLNIIVCKECSLKNSEIDIKRLTIGKQFACIQCPQTFDSESDIQTHAAIHMLNEGTNIECRLCKQVFSSPLKLQTHLIEHNFFGMNQYTCYVCSSVFTTAIGLHNHIIIHGLDSRPYECSLCQMKFFFRAELDNHRFIHIIQSPKPMVLSPYSITNGERYYEKSTQYIKCKYCSNSFIDNSFFQDHLKECIFVVRPKQENTEQNDNNIKIEIEENRVNNQLESSKEQ